MCSVAAAADTFAHCCAPVVPQVFWPPRSRIYPVSPSGSFPSWPALASRCCTLAPTVRGVRRFLRLRGRGIFRRCFVGDILRQPTRYVASRITDVVASPSLLEPCAVVPISPMCLRRCPCCRHVLSLLCLRACSQNRRKRSNAKS